MMDNLQQYFKSNKAYIRDSEENLPYGDESRFEERWEALSRDRIRFRSGLKRRKKPLWKVVAFPVLASLALIFGVRFLMRPIMTHIAAVWPTSQLNLQCLRLIWMRRMPRRRCGLSMR